MKIAQRIIDKLIILDNLPESKGFRQTVGATSKITRNILDNQIIALKKIQRNEELTVQRQLQLFVREVINQILAEHPTVLHICGFNIFRYSKKYEYFVLKPCLATLFCDGGMLSEVLNKMRLNKKLSQRQIQTQQYIFAYGIAVGMKRLYKNKILHRDLKNDNIFVITPKWGKEDIPNEIKPLVNSENKYFIPLIADLGLAKLTDNTNQSQQCGTFYYLAPEVMESTKYSFPVDVYSYAVILSNILQLKMKPDFKCKKSTLFFTRYVTNGGRPDIDKCNQIQKDYLDSIWETKPQLRPTFIDIVDYLKNPQKGNFIFDDFDEDVINAYMKFIDLQVESHSQHQRKNDNIFEKYEKYNRTQEEFYRLEERDALALTNSKFDQDFSCSVTSSVNKESEESENPNYNTKVSKYISLYLMFKENEKLQHEELSQFYLNEGEKSERNKEYETAEHFYAKSIQLGNLNAITKLGLMLLRSNNITTRSKGIKLLKISSENKDSEGLYYYGYLVSEGDPSTNTAPNEELGAKMLYESGQKGHPKGYFASATIYHELGIKKAEEGKTKESRNLLSRSMLCYKKSFDIYGDEESNKISIKLQRYLRGV